MKKIKLFAFPYAGGNANFFRPWKRKLSSFIELHPVELTGRGTRMFEPLYKSVDETVADLKKLFIKNDVEYALFGHSMGTIIIYELLNELKHSGLKMPVHVFFSGRQSPHSSVHEPKNYHLMNEDEFKNEVLKLGGTPQELFDDAELVNLFIPVLRNDFLICEKYIPKKVLNKFEMDFSVLAGSNEGYSNSELNAYGEYTNGKTVLNYFDGGHFFIKDSEDEIIALINSTLQKYIR